MHMSVQQFKLQILYITSYKAFTETCVWVICYMASILHDVLNYILQPSDTWDCYLLVVSSRSLALAGRRFCYILSSQLKVNRVDYNDQALKAEGVEENERGTKG